MTGYECIFWSICVVSVAACIIAFFWAMVKD
jgi:hypothetical protein